MAESDSDLAEAAALFREYQRWLGVDLCFQGFEEELAGLPGAYAAPQGVLLLAKDGGHSAGCVAVRPLSGVEPGICEMKRLYVRDRWRGSGLGRRLAEATFEHARTAGFRRMLLDTLPQLTVAKEMYRRMGFVETDPYYENPLPGVVYMEKIL